MNPDDGWRPVDPFREFDRAVEGCLFELAKGVGLVAFVGWLTRKIDRRRR